MRQLTTIIYLLIAGLLLLTVGGTILLVPDAFHGGNGITLNTNPNLLSEMRAPGALLAGSGIFILLGALRTTLRPTAVQLSVLVYGTFALARLLSIALDGMPSSSLIGAAVLELMVALAGLVIVWGRRAPAAGLAEQS